MNQVFAVQGVPRKSQKMRSSVIGKVDKDVIVGTAVDDFSNSVARLFAKENLEKDVGIHVAPSVILRHSMINLRVWQTRNVRNL